MKCLLVVVLALSSTGAWGMDSEDFRGLNEARQDALQVLTNRRYLIQDEESLAKAKDDVTRLSERTNTITEFMDDKSQAFRTIHSALKELDPPSEGQDATVTVGNQIQSLRRRLGEFERALRDSLVQEMKSEQLEFEKSKVGGMLLGMRIALMDILNDIGPSTSEESLATLEVDIARWIERVTYIQDRVKDDALNQALLNIGRTLDERKALNYSLINVPRKMAAYFETVGQALEKFDRLFTLEHPDVCELFLGSDEPRSPTAIEAILRRGLPKEHAQFERDRLIGGGATDQVQPDRQ